MPSTRRCISCATARETT
ncbi:MAG: hypothetical protein ACREOX_09240 [Stenotrophomonas sp.]